MISLIGKKVRVKRSLIKQDEDGEWYGTGLKDSFPQFLNVGETLENWTGNVANDFYGMEAYRQYDVVNDKYVRAFNTSELQARSEHYVLFSEWGHSIFFHASMFEVIN
jgi:hypothetical protein